MRRAALAALASLSVAALLGGCASAPPAALEERVSGRMSVRVEGDAARSFSAAFELVGTADAGRFALSGPLGQQVARAEWTPREVRLRSRDGERRYADLDAMAIDALGQPVPFTALFDWLRGRPWPGAASRPSGSGFEQLGWQVDVSDQAAGRVLARRDAAPALSVQVRLDLP